MKQESLAVTQQEADAIQCLRDFLRKLDTAAKQAGATKKDAPARLAVSGIRSLPVTTISGNIKPPF